MGEQMTPTDVIAMLTWLQPAIPMLYEAFKNGQPVEAVFGTDRAATDAAFRRARQKRLARRERAAFLETSAERDHPTDED